MSLSKSPASRILCCSLAAVLLALPLWAQKEKELEKGLAQLEAASPAFAAGLKDFDAGRLAQAEKAFAACLAKFPEHAYAHYYLANILYGRGVLPAALSQMELAMAQLDLMKTLGERIDQRKMDKLGAVQHSLDAMWEAAAHSAEPCRNRRSIEWDKREAQDESLETARAAAEKAAAFTRLKAQYTYFLGNILFRLQRVPDAFRRYEEAVRIDPRHADAYNNLIAICYVARQYEVARTLFEQAERQGLDESLNLELKERLFQALGRPTTGILFEDIAGDTADSPAVRRFALAYQPEPAGASKMYVNAYVVHDPRTRDAVLVDPGVKDDRIEAFIRDQGLAVRAILSTHGHPDHVGAVGSYASLLQAPVYAADAEAGRPAGRLKDNDTLDFGGLHILALQTPGHTRDSLSYLVGKLLFSGDTLFRGDIGRVASDGASGRDEALAAMIKVIRARLLTLPDDTVVCPGHGRTTTIGKEKTDNPLLVR